MLWRSLFDKLNGDRSCHQVIHFCSKSHQDLFYTFKEFDSLINHTVDCPHARSRHCKQQNQSLAVASSLSLPLPRSSTNKNGLRFVSLYDTLVWAQRFHLILIMFNPKTVYQPDYRNIIVFFILLSLFCFVVAFILCLTQSLVAITPCPKLTTPELRKVHSSRLNRCRHQNRKTIDHPYMLPQWIQANGRMGYVPTCINCHFFYQSNFVLVNLNR